MARFLHKRKETIGLSPDDFQLTGKKKCDSTKLSLIDYDSGMFKEQEVKNTGEVLGFDKTKTTSWFNIDGLHQEKIIQEITTGFELDPLILSAVLNTYARPKIHKYDNCIYISVKMLHYDEKQDHVSSENLVLIVKENILLSFQERGSDVFEPIRDQLIKNKKRIRASGTDYLTYAILDIVFDNYLYVISKVGEKIENIDNEVINNPTNSVLDKIKKYKSDMLYIMKSIMPCKEIIMNLFKLDSESPDKNPMVHIKELQASINLATETIDTYKEILVNQLSIFQNTISDKLNYTVQFLTIFSVIFIPLTFIAGIYGTNFDNIPELHYKYSYYTMWGVMIIIAISMLIFFKKKKWF